MVGIVVISHGNLAEELISTVDFVLNGKTTSKMVGVSLDTTQDFENFKDIINASIDKVEKENGVLEEQKFE